jgi:alkylated DNA repair dioxygenase AlkB
VGENDAPRFEYYSNDVPRDYVYGTGKGRRAYSPRPFHEEVLKVRAKLEAHCGCKFEVCFLNMYKNQSDSLGWHADDSPDMDDARPIVTVSLGAERPIMFRCKPGHGDPTVEESLMLEHGSCAIMAPGMQDTHPEVQQAVLA